MGGAVDRHIYSGSCSHHADRTNPSETRLCPGLGWGRGSWGLGPGEGGVDFFSGLNFFLVSFVSSCLLLQAQDVGTQPCGATCRTKSGWA